MMLTHTFNSVWKKGKLSPSLVTLCLINWALTCASIIWLFLISPTLNIKQGTPSLWLITAFLENSKVCVLFFGLDNLANTTPTIKAWIITPPILWRHITNIASGHSSVVPLPPYPIVCWVSTLKRKHDVNPKMLVTHGVHGSVPFYNLITLVKLNLKNDKR